MVANLLHIALYMSNYPLAKQRLTRNTSSLAFAQTLRRQRLDSFYGAAIQLQ